MRLFLHRFISAFACIILCIQGYSQSCRECNVDSLYKKLHAQTSYREKVETLQHIVLARLNYGRFVSRGVLDSLISFNEQTKTINAAPYIAYRAAMDAKNPEESLGQLKLAIQLFDQNHRTIIPLLMMLRTRYNSLGRQEERYTYYQQKLNYYLVNGPLNNAAACYHSLGGYYVYKGNYDQAISNYLKAAELFKRFSYDMYLNDIKVIGVTYSKWGNYNKAGYYLNEVLTKISPKKELGSDGYLSMALSDISLQHKDYGLALTYADKSVESLSKKRPGRDYAMSVLQKGLIYLAQNQPAKAYPCLKKAKSVADTVVGGGDLFSANGQFEQDYAWYLYYKGKNDQAAAEKSLVAAYDRSVKENLSDFQLKYLAELLRWYAAGTDLRAVKLYLQKYFTLNEAMQETGNASKIASYENEQRDHLQAEKINNLRQERAVQAAVIYKSRVIMAISVAALILLSCATFFIYRQYRNNKKTLASLRKTQRQLIQSEKMASLGELTAGVAHEIQNPLNFVNNFSEVSIELMDEMQSELQSNDKDEALSIAEDIKQNLEKIRHHGQRADRIVKGMLQHSRAGSNTKEPTDINKLADEYLRLAYHGLRAKDKNFNCELITKFDEKLPAVKVVPQDIGRVLLNLFTNAFYATEQKLKKSAPAYKPTVEVRTSINADVAEIRVRDNGSGIPENIKDKIMQPFFTSKPTGEGTGLGLSLSYDIVVKGHGGTIEVDSSEGNYTEFVIRLPIIKTESDKLTP